MAFDYWMLVFVPILFFAGWWCRGLNQKQRTQAAATPEAYSRGLSLLLNGEDDKAIDTFIELVRLDPDLVELHHVLGKLFRDRGDFERAIRLHRHLYNRADLPDEERAKALKALALDYIKAGLFDRAEAAFRRLSEVPAEHLYALRELLNIYVIEHEWASATETAKLLETQAGEDHNAEIAHFYCERIDIALRRKSFAEVDRLLAEVLPRASATPRVWITAGQARLAEGDLAGALDFWQKTAGAFPDHLPLIVGQMADALMALDKAPEAVRLLKSTCEASRSIDAMEAAVSRLVKLQGSGAAEAIAQQMLQTHPSLLAFNALIQMRRKANPDDEEAKLLAALLDKHARRLSRYQCRKCGFLASSFNWHCLGCGSWDSFPPRRIDDAKKTPNRTM